MADDNLRSLTLYLDLYSVERHALRSLDGVPYSLFRNMVNQIMDQRGNPQAQTSWAEPELWIPERLQGEAQTLALRLWQASQGQLNPRYLHNRYTFANRHKLLLQDSQDVLRLTERGQQFLDEPTGPVVVEIDGYEGIFAILALVAARGPGKRGHFLPDFTVFCLTYTNLRSDQAIKPALRNRLLNLVDRGYVLRKGQNYEITDAGLAYLERDGRADATQSTATVKQLSELRKLANYMSDEARKTLADYLAIMHPYKFEMLIKSLLEEMGYTEVQVTSPTNDKGVDVTANIKLGITAVREVVQVKRYRGNINRTVLDQLRGSLHRFNAVRGTIITTGGFSKGTAQAAFEQGVAPITLIDGETLLDLLTEYQIGISKKDMPYLEFDPSKLNSLEEDSE